MFVVLGFGFLFFLLLVDSDNFLLNFLLDGCVGPREFLEAGDVVDILPVRSLVKDFGGLGIAAIFGLRIRQGGRFREPALLLGLVTTARRLGLLGQLPKFSANDSLTHFKLVLRRLENVRAPESGLPGATNEIHLPLGLANVSPHLLCRPTEDESQEPNLRAVSLVFGGDSHLRNLGAHPLFHSLAVWLAEQLVWREFRFLPDNLRHFLR